MLQTESARTRPENFSRCEELKRKPDLQKNLDPIQTSDALIEELVYHAFWKDTVLRAMDYFQIDVHVKNGVVHLSGHIASMNNQSRVDNAIQTVPGILRVENDLVLDDALTLEVSTSLGTLEHTHHCKFFTGVSHGVVSLNGAVMNQRVRFAAAKCAAANPQVRGVINNIRISGAETGVKDQPFLQPAIGENIYFLDGASGVVKQVIVDPNTRCVVAMTVRGRFSELQPQFKSQHFGGAQSPEMLIVLRMSTIRYLTRDSGFLYIRSDQRDRYVDFDPSAFVSPSKEWVPPYPYCTEDVLFPVVSRDSDVQVDDGTDRSPFPEVPEDASFKAQFYSHNSLGA